MSVHCGGRDGVGEARFCPPVGEATQGGVQILTEELPLDGDYNAEELMNTKPFSGPIWWNSLYWTNFPPLNMFDEQNWKVNGDTELYQGLSLLNSDQRLSEQYCTFGTAREDLCSNAIMPKGQRTFKVEVIQYEGKRESNWHFPLADYAHKRSNHVPYHKQTRRFYDNGVVTLGLNAEEFSFKVMPVQDLDACIHINDYSGLPNVGYHFVLMRIGGWPYRIKKIGTFDCIGDDGQVELELGHTFTDEQAVWQILEGGPMVAPTGSNGEMEVQPNQRIGCKYWAQLLELDWLSPKRDESRPLDPEIPPEKGFVWFRVADTITVPSTGQKGIKIQIDPDGIVPAWLDLNFMQVWAGDIPLGYLNEACSEGPPASRVTVNRVMQDTFEPRATRKITLENCNTHFIFDDPFALPLNDIVDLGWGIRDICYRGARFLCDSRPGKWAQESEVEAYDQRGRPLF